MENSDIKFSSLAQLYSRLYPAFNLKRKELNFLCSETQLWNFLKDTLWNDKTDLNLYDMVNDIFNIDEKNLNEYLIRKRDKQ